MLPPPPSEARDRGGMGGGGGGDGGRGLIDKGCQFGLDSERPEPGPDGAQGLWLPTPPIADRRFPGSADF